MICPGFQLGVGMPNKECFRLWGKGLMEGNPSESVKGCLIGGHDQTPPDPRSPIPQSPNPPSPTPQPRSPNPQPPIPRLKPGASHSPSAWVPTRVTSNLHCGCGGFPRVATKQREAPASNLLDSCSFHRYISRGLYD